MTTSASARIGRGNAMAGAAEKQQPVVHASVHETYASSLATARRLGECAVSGQLGHETGRNVYRLAYGDFVSSIEENLKTDVEFRKWLDVDVPLRLDKIIDGQACAADGSPMRLLALMPPVHYPTTKWL